MSKVVIIAIIYLLKAVSICLLSLRLIVELYFSQQMGSKYLLGIIKKNRELSLLCQGKLKTLFANIWLKFAYKHARLSEILAQSHIFATWLSRCFTLQYRVVFFTVKGSFTNYVYKRRGVGSPKKMTFCQSS